MWGLAGSVVALLLFHAGVLAFLYHYVKFQGARQVWSLIRVGVLIFIVYLVF